MATEQTAMKIRMHDRSGLWFPTCVIRTDAEYDYMRARVTDVDAATRLCPRKWVAVQAGGNVGMWPLRIAQSFSLVHTFEPVSYYFEALRANCERHPNIIVHNELLSERTGNLVPFSERPDGRSRVVSEDQANASHPTTTIDALNLTACDAIFLDVEGHEIEALEGARRTVTEFQPVITVEFWEKNAASYSRYFDSIGYKHVASMHGDRIYAPRAR